MVNWENKTVSVGIDLHKTQFTVCAITSTKEILFEKVYQTNDEGYNAFISECHTLEDKYGAHVSMAIEATSNARYFRNLMQKEGFFTLVINTLKFKVVTLSAKKTDNMMLGYGIVTTATQFQSKKKRLLLLKGLEDYALI